MKTKWLSLTTLLSATAILTSCGSDTNQGGGNTGAQSYKDTKSIVLDILKTEEAQKTMQESMYKNKDKTLKLLSTGEGQQIQLAVKEVLTDAQANKLMEKTMLDPRFAGDFAKALEKGNKQLHKDLLKDPEYQQSLIQAMNNPEYEKLVINVMKSSQYRQQMMNVIQESLQSPLFRVQLMDLFKKVVEEETKPKKLEAQSSGGGGDSEGGEDKKKSDEGGGGEDSGGEKKNEGEKKSDGESGGGSDSGGDTGGDDGGDEEGSKKKKKSS